MRICKDCNIEMIDGTLYGKPRFIDMDHDIDKFYVDILTGNQKSFIGIKYDETKRKEFKVKVCPNCGKVELYIEKD